MALQASSMYPPVVSWSTIQILLTLGSQEEWTTGQNENASAQVDLTETVVSTTPWS